MNVPREIIIQHSKVDNPVTPEELAEVEAILVDTLFSLWLQEKGFTDLVPKFQIHKQHQQQEK